jgi:hypothetical protein
MTEQLCREVVSCGLDVPQPLQARKLELVQIDRSVQRMDVYLACIRVYECVAKDGTCGSGDPPGVSHDCRGDQVIQ